MHIEKIRLYNFRNYDNLNIDFHKNWNILIGENGIGKTNILEGIYYAATTRSPRTAKLKDLIQHNQSDFSISIEYTQNQAIHKVSHKYFYQNNKSNKSIKYNSKNISIIDLLGKIPFVYFVPEDLNIIKGEAKFRRKLLDFVLFQIYPNYKYLINKYNKIIKERNVLLRSIRDKKFNPDLLNEWDDLLIKTSIEIYLKRKKLVDIFNDKLNEKFDNDNIYFKQNKLSMKYLSFLNKEDKLESKQELYQVYKKKLQDVQEREIRYGVSLIGIHRDNLDFFLNDYNLRVFGSQGQQRLYILTLKILIAEIIKDFTDEEPILIFDDVFSELDIDKIKTLIEILNNKYQVFVSAVDINGFKDFFSDNKVFNIQEL